MANPRVRTNSAPSTDSSKYEKSKGAVNMYLPTKSGGKTQIGVLWLKESGKNDRFLLDKFNADKDAYTAEFLSKLIVEYVSIDPDADSDIA